MVVFEECASGGLKCNTTGDAEGELITNSLEGKLAWEIKAKKKVAFDLFPGKGAPGGLFITFNCAGLHLEVRGQVLVNVPSDKMASAVTLKYLGKGGHQKPEKFEGEPPAILETSISGAPFEQSGQTITTTQTNEEALEVNAVVYERETMGWRAGAGDARHSSEPSRTVPEVRPAGELRPWDAQRSGKEAMQDGDRERDNCATLQHARRSRH